MTPEKIAQIKDETDTVALSESLGVDVMAGGKEARCFNKDGHKHGDSNPSMQLFRDGFKCHACGIKGDAIELVKIIKGLPFPEAALYCARFAGVSVPTDGTERREQRCYHSPLKTPKKTSKLAVTKPVTVTPARAKIMEGIWDLVKDLPLTPEACEWLSGRGLDPSRAHGLGCRDFAPVMTPLRTFLKLFSEAEKTDAGLYTRGGKTWTALEQLMRGNKHHQGLFFPITMPGFSFPIAWRLRFYRPLPMNGKPLKVMAQPSACLPTLPLGLAQCDGQEQIFIAEGEPDWLSLGIAFGVNVHLNVLGICDRSSPWNNALTSVFRNAHTVIVMLHETEESKRFAASLHESVREIFGEYCTVVRFLVDESPDANDLLRRGELGHKIEKLVNFLIDREQVEKKH